MSHPILVTGAAGGAQGSTGQLITRHLLEKRIPVRAFVHQLDSRSDVLRDLGAEVVQGDLLNPDSVHAAMKNIKRSYFTYPVTSGLLEATTIFAAAAREARTELVINNSQIQDSGPAPTFRNMQHGLGERILDWAEVGAVHLHAPPYYENVRALVARSVAAQNTVFLPWGDGNASISLVGGQDVAHVAAALLAASGLPSQRAYELVSARPTVNQIVDTLSTVLDRPIRYVEITDEQWASAAGERINAHAVDHLSHLWRYFRSPEAQTRQNLITVTDTIRTVTGREAQTLEQFFRQNLAILSAGA